MFLNIASINQVELIRKANLLVIPRLESRVYDKVQIVIYNLIVVFRRPKIVNFNSNNC